MKFRRGQHFACLMDAEFYGGTWTRGIIASVKPWRVEPAENERMPTWHYPRADFEADLADGIVVLLRDDERTPPRSFRPRHHAAAPPSVESLRVRDLETKVDALLAEVKALRFENECLLNELSGPSDT